MKSYFFKHSACMALLVLPLALLQAGGQKKSILSLEGSGVYDKYVKLTDKVVATPPWFDDFIAKNGVSVDDVQQLILMLEKPGAMNEEMEAWQQTFLSLSKRQDQQVRAAYQKIRDESEQVQDPNEKAYLQALIDYAIFNTAQGILPDSGNLLQTLEDLRSRLQPIIQANKYRLSDLYRLYAEILSRMVAFKPSEIMTLSNNAKRYAEQATKIDEKNGSAYLTLGTWYVYAPSASGGDDNYALELFKKARELGLNNLDLLMSWNMTAIAYDRLRQPEMVRDSIGKALEILPIFQLSLEFQQKIDNNQPLEEFYFE